ncbi:DUF3231 family protein [Paenibacillus prosopidis]|uniref:Uncharacterized protein DUF3231 n=1 Tax=Paenibacillus prosopidis TaxID=630520 RepID=A0A368VZ32_9BACL|nr:DUF3231 family protein [Paenibacillus prosopidis]RCW46597.1 uncharacterized protein DUF3231 [Paenibacillus prosopidis]
MANVIEAAIETIKKMIDDDPKGPLHVGEVMSCWIYLGGLEEAKILVEAGLNTTIDDQLKHALEEDQKLGGAQRKRLTQFMLNEGITLPPSSESKPFSAPNSIPLGVKQTDDELANGLSLKIVSLIITAATASSQSVRDDVGMMFAQFQAEKMILGANIKNMMRERGWLKIPPYYYPPGAPQNN